MWPAKQRQHEAKKSKSKQKKKTRFLHTCFYFEFCVWFLLNTYDGLLTNEHEEK